MNEEWPKLVPKKGKVQQAFQVLNECGNPAGTEFDDACIFYLEVDARHWKRYLESIGVNTRGWLIVPVTILREV